VQVTVKNGKVYEGILRTTSPKVRAISYSECDCNCKCVCSFVYLFVFFVYLCTVQNISKSSERTGTKLLGLVDIWLT